MGEPKKEENQGREKSLQSVVEEWVEELAINLAKECRESMSSYIRGLILGHAIRTKTLPPSKYAEVKGWEANAGGVSYERAQEVAQAENRRLRSEKLKRRA